MAGDLEASVRVRAGDFELDVDLAAPAGATTVVVGPNGAGKTTLLRALAGLTPVSAGRVSLGGRVLDDPGAGTFVPPEARSVGLVFQRHALLPHLSVLDNVAFGPRARGAARRAARTRAAAVLDRHGLGELAPRRVSELSGGQSQRVALARALAADPAALLLDEPFAALDVRARVDVHRHLGGVLARMEGPRLLVTHDVGDAVVLGERVVVLEAGRVVQSGTPGELAAHPATPYVADLVGTNLLRGTAGSGGTVRLPGGLVVVAAAPGPPAPPAGRPAVVVVSPRSLSLHRVRPAGSPRNVWTGTVVAVDDHLGRTRVRVGGPVDVVAEITGAAREQLALRPGEEVWLAVKATEVSVRPA